MKYKHFEWVTLTDPRLLKIIIETVPVLDKYVSLYSLFRVCSIKKKKKLVIMKKKEDDPADNGRNSILDLVAAIKGRLIKGKHLVDNLVVIRTLMTL